MQIPLHGDKDFPDSLNKDYPGYHLVPRVNKDILLLTLFPNDETDHFD